VFATKPRPRIRAPPGKGWPPTAAGRRCVVARLELGRQSMGTKLATFGGWQDLAARERGRCESVRPETIYIISLLRQFEGAPIGD